MDNELFKPSLQDGDNKPSELYDIRNLFYVAFFGGVIPTMYFGTKNSRKLNISNRIIKALISIGIVLLLVKSVLAGLIASNIIALSSRNYRLIFKVVSVLLYLTYYKVMKEEYELNMAHGGINLPLLKPALLWIIFATAIEATLMTIGGLIIDYAL